MTERTTSNKKDFVFCLFILAAIYSCGTLLYYSQTFLLFRFYDTGIVKEMLSGWNYLAQAAGMVLFMILFKVFRGISGKRLFQIFAGLILLPVITVSVFTRSGLVLICMTVLLNLSVGMLTAFAFSLITAYITEKHLTLCFAGAYSIGGIITYIICRLNEEILVSFVVIIFACVFVGIISALILLYKDVPVGFTENPSDSSFFRINCSEKGLLLLIIALMAVIFALGTNDPILVESGSGLDLIFTRFFYAGGLIIAALIFDKSHVIGSICALASILYPVMIIILYRELPVHYIAIALTDTFFGFFSVFRAGIFLSFASKKEKRFLASLGLCVSRIVEGIIALLLSFFGLNRLICFITAGVLFVPLIILFCYLLTKYTRKFDVAAVADNILESPEEAKPSFAERYHLTRREAEISSYLAENKTNGEIADILFLSESTVRFHVSNILKKTGLKNRREVGHRYNEQK
ncbi:MAG: helix-turn-helix transcriptional regulator [Lachnospiraceae bacterium]|nr:helix-turn-helix transcriptional regulator [Lachnospiraceae bacterium]